MGLTGTFRDGVLVVWTPVKDWQTATDDNEREYVALVENMEQAREVVETDLLEHLVVDENESVTRLRAKSGYYSLRPLKAPQKWVAPPVYAQDDSDALEPL